MLNEENDRESEHRIYLVANTDIAMPRRLLAGLAAQVTWRVVASARVNSPERFAAYDADAQPKICLRAKSAGKLTRALTEARAAGIPAEILSCAVMSEGSPHGTESVAAMVSIGPVTRSELPAFIRGLQLLPDEAPPGRLTPVGTSPSASSAVWLAVRADAGIPFGKLAAQAGHACLAAASNALVSSPERVAAWEADGCPVGVLSVEDLPAMLRAHLEAGPDSAFIVDAGRTVFGGHPTPTVLGVGPCTRSELPSDIVPAPDEADETMESVPSPR